MAPVHEANTEHANADDNDEESYIEEEIIEEDEEEILEEEEEEVVEEEIVEEEVVEDDDDDDEVEEVLVEDDEDGEGSISLGDDSPSAPRPVEKKASKSEARSQLLQEIANQRKLAENLKRQNSKGEIKRNKALAELRRQAARDELARSNSKLKTGRIARSIASASTASSIADKKAAIVDPVQRSADVERINTVSIPRRQAPISPLKSRDESCQPAKSSSKIANLKSKLKPTPFGKNSSSRVTEWIRQDPMEKESESTGPIKSEENGKASEKITKGNGTKTSVSHLKKQLSMGSASARSFGQTPSESGSVPLKSRSNDMSISPPCPNPALIH